MNVFKEQTDGPKIYDAFWDSNLFSFIIFCFKSTCYINIIYIMLI